MPHRIPSAPAAVFSLIVFAALAMPVLPAAAAVSGADRTAGAAPPSYTSGAGFLTQDDALAVRRAVRLSGAPATPVTEKVYALEQDAASSRAALSSSRARLAALQEKNDDLAFDYYAQVAAINAELQAGTTAGNPLLTARWQQAQDRLDKLSQSAAALTDLSRAVSEEAARAAFLQESIHAAYALSGAVVEDHRRLQALEDVVSQSLVSAGRLMTTVSDETGRRSAYLRAEGMNMQTLSAAIAAGALYGQSVAGKVHEGAASSVAGRAFSPAAAEASVASAPGRRPLVVIRFDRPNVNYEQAVYTAVSQALDKYPSAAFDLVAVSSAQGDAARMALTAADARKNGESVLRALSQMGLPMERVRLSAARSPEVANGEVHIYIQ